VTGRVHILGSFHFFRRRNLTADLSPHRDVDFLADSGAFSAHNSGAEVTVADYAAWLREHRTVINAAATLDVIGDPVGTARNTERLMSAVDGAVPILPVFHVSSPWRVLEQLCAAHPYVMLGGAVAVAKKERATAMLRWIVRAHQIAREHGTRLHGLGLTRPPYAESAPWYSVDSSYWTSASRTGTISLFDGRRLVNFRCGTPKAAPHARLIRSYGGNPRRAVTPGFGIVREVGPVARQDRDWMVRASIVSMRRYETWLQRRRPAVPPPTGSAVTGDGLKLYLAAGGKNDLDVLIRVSREAAAITPDRRVS